MKNIDIPLDENAEKLFRQIKGIDSARQLESFSEIADLLAQCMKAEEESLDRWRIHLVDVVHFVSSYFRGSQFLGGIANKKNSFTDLQGALTRLIKVPEKANGVLIRFRGHPKGPGIPRKIDYVATYGSLVIDCVIIKAMSTRMGLRMSHLTGRIARAFEVFSENGINTLYIKASRENFSWMKTMEDSLEILSRFNQAVNMGKPIIYAIGGEPRVVLPVKDENGLPDPNLTLVGVLNKLGPEAMKKLVGKIDKWLTTVESDIGDRNAGIYDAVFSVPSLRAKLVRPPVELNNMKWIMKDGEYQKITRAKAAVTRHVMNSMDGPLEKKGDVYRSVYGNDYGKIDSNDLGRRIEHISNLVGSLEKEIKDANVEMELLDNVRSRFEETREDIFDDLTISEHSIAIRSKGGETIIEKVNGKIGEMLAFFKSRAGTRKKIKSMMRDPLDLTEKDYAVIATDFEISIEDAKRIVSLLKSCFDEDGRFRRSEFEKYVPEFAQYENKIFDLFWHFLKETPVRNDRVAFLNSLQHLIVQMKRPEKALKTLLEDVCRNPEQVSFSDRNAFMLANLLVRKYNQELRLDIEITPEEVLDVREGINRPVAELAANIVDEDREAFIAKIRTVHGKLLETIASDGTQEDSVSIRFLLSLEREACIFLALVQGGTAKLVLRSAVKEFGNPCSEVYLLRRNYELVRTMLQHLKLLLRALGRLEDEEAKSVLIDIQSKEEDFYGLGKGPAHEALVRNIVSWARTAQEQFHKTSGMN